jgi:exopolysaccharide production protein ExoY
LPPPISPATPPPVSPFHHVSHFVSATPVASPAPAVPFTHRLRFNIRPATAQFADQAVASAPPHAQLTPAPVRAAGVHAASGHTEGHVQTGTSVNDALIRVLDIIGALFVLIMALPIMVVIALAVKLTSPGPVLFAHHRVGRHGRHFACLKFRTMAVDADAQLQALLDRDPAARAEWQKSQKLRRDPRVTSIGRFLRRTSLDELPQLFTVLGGEMSLVGPRPIVASEIERYGRHFAVYCKVRPGLTGLWQVQRHAGTSYRRRVAFDVAYARGRSPRLYLLILARTVPAVLSGRGAW